MPDDPQDDQELNERHTGSKGSKLSAPVRGCIVTTIIPFFIVAVYAGTNMEGRRTTWNPKPQPLNAQADRPGPVPMHERILSECRNFPNSFRCATSQQIIARIASNHPDLLTIARRETVFLYGRRIEREELDRTFTAIRQHVAGQQLD